MFFVKQTHSRMCIKVKAIPKKLTCSDNLKFKPRSITNSYANVENEERELQRK